ncbi:MAG: hypothetical protein OXU96_09955, partial [Gammaproteobacteria bacterium]|nr:hypothetical protein [Gammaproteobacteria bacterium]
AHDTINEAAQTVVFTLSMPVGAHGAGTGLSSDVDERVVIMASDPITVSFGVDASGNEGDTGDNNALADRISRQIRLTVTAAGATSSDWNNVQIPFTLSDAGTAMQASYAGITDPTMDFPTGGDFYTFTPSGGAQTVTIDLRAGRGSDNSNASGEPIATIWAVPQL